MGYRIVSVVLSVIWAQPVIAVQIDLNASYRVETTDNSLREHEISQRLDDVNNSATLGFSLLENSPSLVARVVAAGTYNNYLNNTLENHTSGSLNAYGEGFFINRLFSWVVADGFRQLLIDPLATDTPGNRTNSNAWHTGPNFYFHFGPVDTLQLEGRYGGTRIDDPELLYRRHSYATRWLHRTSPRTVFSLNYEWLRLDYDSIDAVYGITEPFPEVSRHRLYVRSEFREAGNIMNANLGMTRVDQLGVDADPIPLIYFSLSRQSGASTLFGIRYRNEYSDIGGELLPTAPLTTETVNISTIPTAGTDTISQDPYSVKQFDVFHSRTGATFPTYFQIFYRDSDYLTQPDDREETGATAIVQYYVTPTWALQLQGTYQKSIFWQQLHVTTNSVRKDRDSSVGITLTHRLTPHWRISLEGRRFERRTSWIEEGYTEDRFAMALIYQHRPSGR